MARVGNWRRTVLAGLVVTSIVITANASAGARQDDPNPPGTAWARVPHDSTTFGGSGDQVPIDVVAGGPGFVAIGNDSVGPLVQPAVWSSTDGTTWGRIATGSDITDEAVARQFVAIAASDDMVVVVGTEGIDCIDNFDLILFGACERTRQAAWWSSDGATWNRVPHDGAVFDDRGDSTMVDVVAGPDGFYALGNNRLRDDWNVDLFFSPDGTSWQRVHGLDSRWPLSANRLTATGSGVIAFTAELVQRRIAPIFAAPAGGGWVLESAFDDDPPPRTQIVSLGTGTGPYADQPIGVAADFVTTGAATWSADGTTFALGPLDEGVRTIWSTTDGLTWVDSTSALLTAAAPASVVSTSDGFVAVQFFVDGDVLSTLSWTSTDGATWVPSGVTAPELERVDAGAGGVSTVPGGIVDVAVSRDGLTVVAVGVDSSAGDADAAFWFSREGIDASVSTEPSDEPPTASVVTPDGCELAADASCTASDLDRAQLAGLRAPRIDLSFSNLADANLIDADLSGALLDGSDLRGADLTGADLTGASLVGTRFDGATLDDATLTDVTVELTDFTDASLRNADVGSVDLGGFAPRIGAILGRADLRGADLASADLGEVDLRGADLTGANLTGAGFSGARARGAIFADAIVQQARLSEAELTGADLTGILAREASFTLADLRDAHLTGADLTNASLFGADMVGTDLTGASIPVTNFIEAILRDALLPSTGLDGADWGSTICPDGSVTGSAPSAPCSGQEVGG